MENNTKFKSLESLEQKVWPAVNPDEASYLIVTCTALRKKILNDFSIEDLRIMIGQNIGLKYLIPLALEELNKNILAEGDYYAGDLLKAVLTCTMEFWKSEEIHYKNMIKIIERKEAIFADWEMKKEWSQVIETF